MPHFNMVGLAQLARAPGCGPGGRRFEPDISPQNRTDFVSVLFFLPFSAKWYYLFKLKNEIPPLVLILTRKVALKDVLCVIFVAEM